MTYQRASIILPVYRQAGHIGGIVRELELRLATLPIPHETILVLNGPDDGGLEICRSLEQEFESVRVLEHDRLGWGGAVRRGLDEATGDLLCYTNSARTSVDTLMVMLEFSLVLPGIVIKANRKTRDSVLRHLGSLIYNLESRALFDLSNFDINGTPKVFPRAFGDLLALRSTDDLIDLEFLAVCRRRDHLVLEVPVVVTKRRGGASTTTAISAFRMYLGAIRLARRFRAERSISPR